MVSPKTLFILEMALSEIRVQNHVLLRYML